MKRTHGLALILGALAGLGPAADPRPRQEDPPEPLVKPPPGPHRVSLEGPITQWCPTCQARPGRPCDPKKFRKWSPGKFHNRRKG